MKAFGELAAGYDEYRLHGRIQHICGGDSRNHIEAYLASPYPSWALLLVGHFDMLFSLFHRFLQVPLLSVRSQVWEAKIALSGPLFSICSQLRANRPKVDMKSP